MKASIQFKNGSTVIEVNGKALTPMAFTPHAFTRDREYLRQLGAAGIEVFFLICDLPWLNSQAIKQLEEDTKVLVESVPNAKIFLRLGMHPPASWVDAHPDERMQYNGDSCIECDVVTESYQGRYSGMYALYSDVWRKDAGEELLKFMEYLQKSPFVEHYIGIFFAGGNTSEWYPATKLTIPAGDYAGYNMDAAVAAGILPDLKARGERYAYNARSATQIEQENFIGDTSLAFQREFSRFLTEKYGTEENLKKQWKDENASFVQPKIPGLSERFFTTMDGQVLTNMVLGLPAPQNENTNVGMFLNTDTYQNVSDFYRAFHLGAANSIIYFGELLKKHYPQYLTGSFYGYFGSLDYFNMPMCAGGRKILDSGMVDILACPNNYFDRQPGGYACQRVMQDSFRLRGCMFFSEDDTRTHLDGTLYRNSMQMFDKQDSINAMKRDFGRDICEDIYGWWFDQVEAGRYKDEALYALMKRQQVVAQAAFSTSRVKHNEIAVLYDEESVHCVPQDVSFRINELYRTLELPRIGAPVDYYYQKDLALDAMPNYKLYIFMNCFSLDDDSRRAICEKIKKRGATALFLYAQGFINPDKEHRLDVRNLEELTEIHMTQKNEAVLTSFRLHSEYAHTIGCDDRKLYGYIDRMPLPGCSLIYAAQQPYAYPFFVPCDSEADVLARFAQNGEPALVRKTVDGFTSVFSGTYWLSSEIVRAIAKDAGCHIYQSQGDYVFANESFVTIHAKEGGKKTITFKQECTPFEVYEGKVYGEKVKQICFEMKVGETKMFAIADTIREKLL